MKKNYTSILFVLFILIFNIYSINTAKCQNRDSRKNIKNVSINFANRDINLEDLENIKEGQFYQIIIDSINLNYWDIQIDSKDTIISHKVEFPNFGIFNFDAITNIISGLQNMNLEAPPEIQKAGVNINSNKSGKALIEKIKEYFNQNNINLTEKDKKYSASKIIDEINDSLRLIPYKLYKLLNEIDLIEMEINSIILNSKRLKNKVIYFKDRDINYYSRKYNESRKKMDKIFDNLHYLNKTYLKRIKPHEELIKKDKELKKQNDKIVSAFTVLVGGLTKYKSLLSPEKINQSVHKLISIENNSENIYRSLPFKFTGEKTNIKLYITPKDKSLNGQTYNTHFSFPVKSKNYFGTSMSFYISNISTKSGSISSHKHDTNTYYKVVAEDTTNIEFGTTALFHYGKRGINFKNHSFEKIGYHFSIGPGISISNKIRPRLLFGGGLSFGKKHMFTIDFGCIMGATQKFSNAIDFTTEYIEKPIQTTVSTFQTKAFISFGYMYNL